MEHIEKVKEILQRLESQTPIDYSQIASESYELFVSELDRRLLPVNCDKLLIDDKVRVYYYAYDELIVYVITHIRTDIPIITGLLVENKLQAYIINQKEVNMFWKKLTLDIIVLITTSCLNELQQNRKEKKKAYNGKKTVKC